MIIWGWRTLKGTAATGDFHCPHCANRQGFNHEKLRRWFTLYFIPVIPVGAMDEQVTCTTCKKSWQMSVLANDPEKLESAQLSRIASDWLSSMAALAASRGGPTPEISASIVADIASVTGIAYQPGQVTEAAAALPSPVADATIVARLGSLAADLSTTGQEQYLNSAVRLLRKLTNFGPDEANSMRAVAGALGVTSAHLNGILLSSGLHTG